MNTEKNHTEFLDLIHRYLASEASDDDVRQLEEWVKEKPENKKVFLEYKKTWQFSSREKIHVDTAGSWKSLLEKIGEQETEEKKYPFPSQKTNRSLALRIAAVAILLIVSAAVLYFMFGVSSTQEFAASEVILEEALEDGSKITLDAHSRLTYPSGFAKNERKVRLLGSAFFEVTQDRDRPFIIETPEAAITVLGTSFFVNAREDEEFMEVVVSTGRVNIASREGTAIELSAGEKGLLNKETARLEKTVNTNPNYLAWKTKTFIFEDSRLEEVIHDISNNYHVEIVLTNAHLRDCRLTATYMEYSLEDILMLVAETLNLTVSGSGSHFVLDGPDCK